MSLSRSTRSQGKLPLDSSHKIRPNDLSSAGDQAPTLPKLDSLERNRQKLDLARPVRERASDTPTSRFTTEIEADPKALFKAIKPILHELRSAAFREVKESAELGRPLSPMTELIISCCQWEGELHSLTQFLKRETFPLEKGRFERAIAPALRILGHLVRPAIWALAALDRVLLQLTVKGSLMTSCTGLVSAVAGYALDGIGKELGGMIGSTLSAPGDILALAGIAAFQLPIFGLIASLKVKSDFTSDLKEKLASDPSARSLVATYIKQYQGYQWSRRSSSED